MALIPPAVVQQQYGIPTNQPAHWRRQGAGPEYFTLGPRSIRYYPADIDDWLTQQTPHPDRHGGKAGMQVDQVVLAGNSGGSSASVSWNG